MLKNSDALTGDFDSMTTFSLVSELCLRLKIFVETSMKCGDTDVALEEIEKVVTKWAWISDNLNSSQRPKILLKPWVKVRISLENHFLFKL